MNTFINDSQLNEDSIKRLIAIEQSLTTEACVYREIAQNTKSKENTDVLNRIAKSKEEHAGSLALSTGYVPMPNRRKVHLYTLIAKILGFTFAVKLMKRNKSMNLRPYELAEKDHPAIHKLHEEESKNESELLSLLDEDRIHYVGSMVLGMNDAIVEISGTLAGLTLAMQNTRLIALSGLITGIAATLSMAASEYLSVKSSGAPNAVKSCIYTGVTYLITVALLILPYLLYDASHYLWAMFTMIGIVLLILIVFNFYISVAEDVSFRKRFGQMAGISLGVSALSFVLGVVVKIIMGVDI